MEGESSSCSSSSCSSSSCSSSSRPRVHFPQQVSQVVCEIEDVLSLSQEDKQRLWFSRSDYDFSKSSARVIAQESERYGQSKHLDNAYGEDAQASLNLWALHGLQRRGLERWANTAHGDLRKKDQHRYISSILRAQTEMNLKGISLEVRQQMVSSLSQNLSQRATQFAQRMANADAEAAKWEHAPRVVGLGLGSPKPKLRQSKGGVSKSRSSNGLRANSNGASPRITIRTRKAPARVSRMA